MSAAMGFGLFNLALWLGVVAGLTLTRGRVLATFVGVVFGLQGLAAVVLVPGWPEVWPVAAYGQLAAGLYFLRLARPRPQGAWFRLFIALPGSWFSAGALLSLPWAALAALTLEPAGIWVPWLAAGFGVLRSVTTRREDVDLVLGSSVAPELVRWPRGDAPEGTRPLRVVQITDPHLGSFMTPQRLARICERAVAMNPDLVVLTGDFLTMETNGSRGLLAQGLAPLRAMEGRTFACLGNHDHEAPDEVRAGLAAAGVRLLVDDAALVDTPAGPVQLLGMEHRWRDRAAAMRGVCARHPRVAGALRLVLLHDPGAFAEFPPDQADLVLSGHTHGGQVGLVSFGLPWTAVSALSDIPDHGFWALGGARLYVHRGTGHYGFPLRLGVPAEESLLRVHRAGC